MIIRVVKMVFEAENVEEFKSNFMANKDHIRSFEGCQHLELWNDTSQVSTFFTYSHWDSEAHLNAYRESSLFKAVWAKTKPLFAERPEAWSMNRMATGNSV